jgi:hypothetical protein
MIGANNMSNKQNDDFFDRMVTLKDLIESDIEKLNDRKKIIKRTLKSFRGTDSINHLIANTLNSLIAENENARFYLESYLRYFNLEE